MSGRAYVVNEMFLSIQGEGLRAGTPNVFIRFSGCNLSCNRAEDGFDCDTEFTSGRKMTAADIVAEAIALAGPCRWVILTGGEPTLQVDEPLIIAIREAGFRIAIETNGTRLLPGIVFDWIACSPKTAEHTLQLTHAHELRYVRAHGQAIPRPIIKADHLFISPAFSADGLLGSKDLRWCIDLVKANPEWSLSVQQHKLWGVR